MNIFKTVAAAAALCTAMATSAAAVTFTPNAGFGTYSFDVSFTSSSAFSSGFLGFIQKGVFDGQVLNSNRYSGTVLAFVNGVGVDLLSGVDLGNTTAMADISPSDFVFSQFTVFGSAVVNTGDTVRFVTTDVAPDIAQGTFALVLGSLFLLDNNFMIASGSGTDNTTVPVVPLPASMPLLALGLAGLVAITRRNS